MLPHRSGHRVVVDRLPAVAGPFGAQPPDRNPNLGHGGAPPREPIAELPIPDPAGVVPHYSPGENPFVKELTERHNIPVGAVLGGAESLYPEYRKKLTADVPPAICKRYCGCGGLGVPCIGDGTGVAK